MEPDDDSATRRIREARERMREFDASRAAMDKRLNAIRRQNEEIGEKLRQLGR